MKALALLSGGLDSTLAIKLVLNQGIEVEVINFFTPFCLCNRKSGGGYEAKKVADKFGVKLKILNVADDYLEVVKAPKHGYGKNMNPCIDCRIFMHKKAKEYMEQIGASFIITGEVLGQRPMSQHRAALKITERESGLEGLVLRPLSAKLLPLTIPEKEGWVKRQELLEISGRSRKPQIELAAILGIKDYPCSAGGCLLTDSGFAKRIKDLISYKELNLANVNLLKIGRHFRLSEDAKLAVGRNEEENKRLLNLARKEDHLFFPLEIAGPTALGRGHFNDKLIQLSCSMVCRYCDLDGKDNTDVGYKRFFEKENMRLTVKPAEANIILKLRI